MTETNVENMNESLPRANSSSTMELSTESDETNIPICLLEEIVEEGEDSIINPQACSSTSEIDSEADTSFTLPLEVLQNYDSIFSLGGQEYFLNKSRSKSLIIGLTSSRIPELKVTFKLHDLGNDCCVVFSRKEWKQIVRHEIAILENLLNNVEEQVCDCDQMRIETLVLYNRPCVKFHDNIVDTHCTLALETFQHMMLLKSEIEEGYTRLSNKIKDVAKRVKLFMDTTFFLLFKSNNIDYRHNYNRQLLSLNKSTNFLDLSSSVAETWKQLGDWISKDSSANNSNV